MIPPLAERVLREARTIAVVGYSSNPERPSHWIADYLEQAGYVVHRVNPKLQATPERVVYAGLGDVPGPIDVVQVFRAPSQVPEVAEEAIAVAARVLWMQPGAESQTAADRARAGGLEVVIGRCMYADHKAWREQGGGR